MSKKVLFCATVDYHFKAFHLPHMKRFQEQGWEVHVAASGNMELPYTDEKYNIPIQRSPFHIRNISAYRVLKKLIEENNYDIIHCHTPVGGVLARLAARRVRKVGTKVLYTAHGFHFCKGAPLLSWMLYYPIERMFARYTDCLITINEEDYKRAVNHGFRAKRIEHVHGVGIDTERFKPVDEISRDKLRGKFGYKKNDFLMFYAAEFNKNKNQQLLIKALAEIKNEIPNARLLLAGKGPLMNNCINLVDELNLSSRVDFLGYRNDLEEILPMCDVAVASSFREGLPVNIMEAMACGLPIIATDNRGHKELVHQGTNGYIAPVNNYKIFSGYVESLYKDINFREQIKKDSIDIVKPYSISQVNSELKDIYLKYGK